MMITKTMYGVFVTNANVESKSSNLAVPGPVWPSFTYGFYNTQETALRVAKSLEETSADYTGINVFPVVFEVNEHGMF